MSLKDSLIQQTEQALDGLRKRNQEMRERLTQGETEEQEAREMLYFLKNGSAPPLPSKNGAKTRQLLNYDDALAGLDAMPTQFTTHEFADCLGVSRGAANQWGKRFVKEGKLKRLTIGRGPNPSKWEKP